MEARIFLYAFGIWFIFVILAILNGVFRNSFITPKTGEHTAHVISTIILISVILIVTYLFIGNIKTAYTNTNLLLVGTLWVGLTVLFEFIFGHYVAGNSWGALLADYNILKGRVWSLVLFTELIAPLLFGLILKE